ncbi:MULTISPECIES: mycothione reductase [Mycobacteriaceae]|uniref:Mycothione reductase n=1 Tax=Mycolicibacterium mucogenicum DSM 44124 TaxID=1226753 RepID=A0A8E4RBR9_MYCMU|nr:MULTISPECIES: mycothione reductase [Mycobacteriaceae]KAB7758074.1 mycothione reductase [Mycolicibacterium mucogenicum DSM 44124]QPG71502.1 mycothione reductase [Mycolicibacterium mucogenicum DSM 44124]SDZ93471.1 mycothione reductase [Mycobacterium sp. 283mftsu]
MEHYDLTIIGTGSGNSVLDERYDGLKVAICEQGKFGGTCLNVGCIPTKMFVYAADVAQTIRHSATFGVDSHIDGVRWPDIVERVFGRIDPIAAGGEDYRRGLPNITVYGSHTRFGPTLPDGTYTLRTADGDEFSSDRVVIAAGSRSWIPPTIAGSGVPYFTSDDIMRIPALPEHLVIIGGGFISVEFAHVFSALGSKVTIVLRGDRLLRRCDEEICRRFSAVVGKKWDLRTQENVVSAQRDGDGVVLEFDDGETLRADALLVATGRVPNGDLLDVQLAGVSLDDDGYVVVDEFQRTTARGIFALGDVSSHHQLKHVANHEARTVKENLLRDWDGELVASDHRFVPAAVFTDPQVAMVGMNEAEARAAGFDVVVKVQDYGDTAYGWAMEDTTGIVKLIGERGTGRILGAHLMGYQASSLIQPLIQAMSFGQTAQDVARGQYWIHPALPEVIENALLGLI